MVINASKLRGNVYRLFDQVLETGEIIEIDRKSRRLKIVPVILLKQLNSQFHLWF